ncbi:MAG: hypothetical protein WBE18_06235 [Gammaproteobacteria bacterium]
MKAQKQKQSKPQDKEKVQQLFAAIEAGDGDTFNRLFSGEDPNSKLHIQRNGVAYDATLLFWALKHQKLNIFLRLLLAKADPNMPFAVQGRQGIPLLWAISLSAIDNKCEPYVLLLLNNKVVTRDVSLADESVIREYFQFLCRNVDKVKVALGEFLILRDHLSGLVNIPLAEGI